MANEFIIKNGFHSKGDSQITGSLIVSGNISASGDITLGHTTNFSGYVAGTTPYMFTNQSYQASGDYSLGFLIATGSTIGGTSVKISGSSAGSFVGIGVPYTTPLTKALTVEGDISASGVVFSATGSFNHLHITNNALIGSSSTHTTAGGLPPALYVHNNDSGYDDDLPIDTTLLIENNAATYMGAISPTASVGGFYMGCPSDVFGAVVNWGYDQGYLNLSAAQVGHGIHFKVGNKHSSSMKLTPVDSSTGDINANLTLTGSIDITSNITASGNISASGTMTAVTGSFSHLVGNSPITISDQTTFTLPITASGGFSGEATNIYRPITTVGTNPFTASADTAGGYYRMGGNVTCSIILNATASCPIGSEFEFFQTSSVGYVLFETGSVDITLNSKSGNVKLAGQFSAATLKKVNTDEWDLIGDLG